MTDIFVRRDRPRRGRVFFLMVLLLLAAAAVAVFYWPKRPAPAAPEPLTDAPTPSLPAAPSPAPAPAAAPDIGLAQLAEARRLRAAEDLAAARDLCFAILDQSSNAVARAEAENLLGEIHILLITTQRAMPEKVEHTVASGDSLGSLARQYGTTIELIQKSNGISGQIIRLGDRLRILNGKFAIRVDKTRNTLVLTLNDRFFKRYRVGTGQFGRTPGGAYVIEDRIPQPTWWRPDGKEIPYGDTNNLLGTHWLKLNVRGYGIHGTWEPETIGKQSSAGCIRLLNSDIEELYTIVPVGTPVVIAE